MLIELDTKARTVYIWTDAAKMNNREYKRDDKGQFAPVDSGTKGNKDVAKPTRQKAGLGKRQDLRGKRISRRELGTIKTDLFKNYNEEEAIKGDEYICKTAKFRYIIRLNEDGNLANFSPVYRWRIK